VVLSDLLISFGAYGDGTAYIEEVYALSFIYLYYFIYNVSLS